MPADATSTPPNRCVVQPAGSIDLRRPDANELFVDPCWWRVIEETYGMETTVHTARDARGHLVGAVPFIDIDDPGGRRRKSLPFCDFIEAPINDASWDQIVSPLMARDPDVPLKLATPADHPATNDDRFISVIDAVHHVIDVDRHPNELLAGYAELPRRQVRKSARAGIRFRLGTDMAALEAYHRLHVGVRKYRHQLLAQPMTLFENIKANFFDRGNGGVMLGELNGDVVGACLLLVTPTAVHYKFSASDPDHRRNGVSHGAVHAAIAYTHELGRPRFDFGRSDIEHAGLVDFKRRFRPVERQLAYHRSARRPINDFRRQLDELTQLYIDPAIPDALTAAAGAHLYRYFA